MRTLKQFFQKYFKPELVKETYFNGNFSSEKKANNAFYLVLDCLRFNIWNAKLQKNNISFYTIEIETVNLIELICNSCKKIKDEITRNPFINSGRDDEGRRDEDDP